MSTIDYPLNNVFPSELLYRIPEELSSVRRARKGISFLRPSLLFGTFRLVFFSIPQLQPDS